MENNRCITFENLKVPSNNSCLLRTYSSLTSHDKPFQRTCLECEIKDINIIVEKSCQRNFTCISFIFNNNTFFEQFFQQHPTIIHYLQKVPNKRHAPAILMITIESYNLTEISFKYLNSLIYINLSSYDILQFKFIKSTSGVGIANVKNDFLQIPIETIYLSFSCNYEMNDNDWIRYVIKPNDIELKRSGICQRSHSSTQVMITSNTTIKSKSYFSFIQLLQKSNPVLFYLLLSCPIFVICTTIIALSIFTRRGYRKKGQVIDRNLGTRSSVNSVDTSNTMTSEKSPDSLLLISKGVTSSLNKQANDDNKHTDDPNKRVVDNF